MARTIFDIPELADFTTNYEAVTNHGLIRIPMEQDVPFTPRVAALVDTPAFQRLSQITQLGLATSVYPGATHTRFEHALGVFHNAIRYLRQLAKEPRFQQIVDAHSAELLMVSALLHDVGHWPFCHPIEDMGLPNVPHHEQFAAHFLENDAELVHVLRSQWQVEPQEILELLTGKNQSPSMRLLYSILSGPIDIDKMDYLDRDSLHAGVPYGRNFDRNRLIHSLVLNENGDGLAISSKGKTAAELMVFARYVMFSEIYWHHAVRSATCMFVRAFFDLHQQIDLNSFFQLNEMETIQSMRQQSAGRDCEQLVSGIFGPKRQLYKRIAEFSLYQSPEIYHALARQPYEFLVRCTDRLTAEITAAIGDELGDDALTATDLLIDAPPMHREIEFNVDIYFPKEQVYRPLQQVSPVVDALARTQFDDYVKRVRIFAHPRIANKIAKRTEFTDWLQRAVLDTPQKGE